MLVVISGEGPSDMGSCSAGGETCEGDDFSPGATALLVDALLQEPWGFSPLEVDSMRLVPERVLCEWSRGARITALPGKKKDRDSGYFFKNSYALAQYAGDLEREVGCKVLAVLFRDCDGTRSAAKGIWHAKHSSMKLGFAAAGFSRGVPMIPKPKSEVWLLCALQPHPYQNCERFEAVSGNDASPNSAKRQLHSALTARGKTCQDVNDLILNGSISAPAIDMPSFNAFRDRLLTVATSMVAD